MSTGKSKFEVENADLKRGLIKYCEPTTAISSLSSPAAGYDALELGLNLSFPNYDVGIDH